MTDVEFLARVPIFSSLPTEDLKCLADLCKPIVRDAGYVIFKKGDPPEAMYLIRSGKIAITTWTEDNQELFLSMLHEGDFFGELALIDGSPRTASAKVFENVDLLEITRDDFLLFLRSRSDVCLAVTAVIAQRLRTANLLLEQRTTRNVNEEIEHRMSFGDRVADKIAQFGGSWPFIGIFFAFLFSWMILNSLHFLFAPWDKFPFVFLNLMLSTIAAVQAPIIMMSQNRQAAKDRIRAELDYQVNLKAELQIQSLHIKMDELRAAELRQLYDLQREQMAAMRRQLDTLDAMLAAKR